MTNYARGRAFEYRVRNELRSKGYVVIRSASSKGAADLVAIRPMHDGHWILFIQCKKSEGALPPDEWNALCKLAEAASGVPVWVKAGGRGNKKAYYILTALKDGHGGKQPMREFQP